MTVCVVIFRSRLREGVAEAYGKRAEAIYQIAASMPGLISATDYVADDGERVAIIEFETVEHLIAWRDHPEHLRAQQEGRDRWYASYSIQICQVQRSSRFDATLQTWTKQP